MPFLTEELWAITGEAGPKRERLLALSPWPQLDGLGDAEAEAEIGWVVDLVSEIRSVRSEMNVPAGAQIPLVLVAAPAAVVARAERWSDVIRRLARLSDVAFADGAPPESAQMIVRDTLAVLPLAGVIDIGAERIRLTREVGKEEAEVRKIDGKLGNPDFVRRAPEDVVEENRERREAALGRIEKLRAALRRLEGGGQDSAGNR
jgi:valyl-tRNA synthetase